MNKLTQAIECSTGTCGHMSHQLLTTTSIFLLVTIAAFTMVHYFIKD